MVPYSATDVLRVLQYELASEPVRTYGNEIASDTLVNDDRRDDWDSDGDGRGRLIRLIGFRHSAPVAA